MFLLDSGGTSRNGTHKKPTQDYGPEASVFMVLILLPYTMQLVVTYPVQPMLVDGALAFASVKEVFPDEEWGPWSPLLCVGYTIVIGMPKYLICDAMLLTFKCMTDLERKFLPSMLAYPYFGIFLKLTAATNANR